MPIVCCRLIPYSLPLRQAWQTNRGSITQRTGWLLELTSDTGRLGYGDCAPLPEAGTETHTAAAAWLTDQLPLLHNRSAVDALTTLPPKTHHPAARHALETALLDLISQSADLSLRQWLSPTAGNEVAVNGAGGPLGERASSSVTQLAQQGYRVVKLKVGLAGVEREIGLLRQLSAAMPAGIGLRLDANGAWNRRQARKFIGGLAGLPIESLEEPLQEPRVDWLFELQRMTEISLALDESLPQYALQALLEHPPVRRLIIKPCVLGGLLYAKTIADRAAQAGLETVVTSTLESAVGIQAAAQLAMALQPVGRPLAQGLATSDWFRSNLAEPPAIRHGRLRLTETVGLGIHPHPKFTNDLD